MLNYVLFSFKTIRNLLLYLKFIVYIILTYNIYKTYILISVIFIFLWGFLVMDTIILFKQIKFYRYYIYIL